MYRTICTEYGVPGVVCYGGQVDIGGMASCLVEYYTILYIHMYGGGVGSEVHPC